MKAATLLITLSFGSVAFAQEIISKRLALRQEAVQSDFPALALDAGGRPWIAYVAWDGKEDTLRLARAEGRLSRK